MKTERGLGWIDCVALSLLVIVSVGLAAGPVKAWLKAPGGRARRANCSSNLRQIGLGLEHYFSRPHAGSMPVADAGVRIDLREALCHNGEGILGDCKALQCPSVTARLGEDPERCDYVIFPRLARGAPGNMILIAEKPGNHPDGANLLYRDVHIKFVHGAQWDAGAYARWLEAFAAGDQQAALMGPEEWQQREQ